MYAITVEVTVHPGKTDEFLEAISTQAQTSRDEEPGCLRFEVLQRRDDPSRYVLIEVYESEEAFLVAHRETPHYAQWAEAANEVLLGDREVIPYEPVRIELPAGD